MVLAGLLCGCAGSASSGPALTRALTAAYYRTFADFNRENAVDLCADLSPRAATALARSARAATCVTGLRQAFEGIQTASYSLTQMFVVAVSQVRLVDVRRRGSQATAKLRSSRGIDGSARFVGVSGRWRLDAPAPLFSSKHSCQGQPAGCGSVVSISFDYGGR